MKTPILTLLTDSELSRLSKQDDIGFLLKLEISTERLDRICRQSAWISSEVSKLVTEIITILERG